MSRLLLVDDNPSIHKIAVTLLGSTAIDVYWARSAQEAIGLIIKEKPFDVAMIDTTLPEMDGWELLGRLRGNPKTEKMPIAMMAGVLDDIDHNKVNNAPIQAFLLKPIDLRALPERIQSLMSAPVEVGMPFSATKAIIPSDLLLLEEQDLADGEIILAPIETKPKAEEDISLDLEELNLRDINQLAVAESGGAAAIESPTTDDDDSEHSRITLDLSERPYEPAETTDNDSATAETADYVDAYQDDSGAELPAEAADNDSTTAEAADYMDASPDDSGAALPMEAADNDSATAEAADYMDASPDNSGATLPAEAADNDSATAETADYVDYSQDDSSAALPMETTDNDSTTAETADYVDAYQDDSGAELPAEAADNDSTTAEAADYMDASPDDFGPALPMETTDNDSATAEATDYMDASPDDFGAELPTVKKAVEPHELPEQPQEPEQVPEGLFEALQREFEPAHDASTGSDESQIAEIQGEDDLPQTQTSGQSETWEDNSANIAPLITDDEATKAVVDGGQSQQSMMASPIVSELLSNPEFIDAIAKAIAERLGMRDL
ncbi:MAG: response regulator [Holophagales bacterium]|jgi:CheY-like chemotaxis protein|nr:response regulator [Holophagales bacterium]